MKQDHKKSLWFFILLFLILSSCIGNAAFELTFPITFHTRAEFERLTPKSSTFFVDGNIQLSNDMINMKDSDDFDIGIFGGASIWTSMGYIDEFIMFNPRAVHYSLFPGIRAHIADYLVTVQLRHDCYHEIDRDEVPTIIWNVFDFRFANIDYLASNRRERFCADSSPSLRFYPRFYWSLGVGLFPHIKYSSVIFQESHPIKKVWEADLGFLAFRYAKVGWMINWKPSLWLEKHGKKDWRQYAETAIGYFGSGGIMSLYYGYTWKDDQPIAPREQIKELGIRWEL